MIGRLRADPDKSNAFLNSPGIWRARESGYHAGAVTRREMKPNQIRKVVNLLTIENRSGLSRVVAAESANRLFESVGTNDF